MRTGDHDDVQDIRDELAGLRAELESVRQTQAAPWRRARARIRSMRRLTVVGIAALMLAVPVAVSAVHDFTDVPTSNTFHTTISRLAGAGITGGCGSGKFCPNSAVTRGQMAAFLNRGLGRAAQDGEYGLDDWELVAGVEDLAVSVASLTTGGGSGGTGHVLVTGYFTAWTNEIGVCPCEVYAYLWDPDSDEFSQAVFDNIGSESAPSADPDGPYFQGSVSISHLFTAPSGAARTYYVVARIIPTTPPSATSETIVTGWRSAVQALYVPFTGDGTNPELPATTGSGQRPSRGDVVTQPPATP